VTHRFREGESSARVPENLPGEFGELARDFNFMLDAMAGYNGALQAEVKAATSQLVSRNR
jgi:nitrate/nitrite-specific signal transduction histidine kinase